MKTKNLIVFLVFAILIILFFLAGCAINRRYVPMFPHKYNRYDAMFKEADSVFTVKWKDSIRNPENAEFVDEVSFNEGIPFNKVTQKQFNKRYEIK